MRPVVSTSSVAAGATFTAITGSVSADYPIGNLADLVQPNLPARITPSGGAIAFKATYAADQTVQLVALVAHTLPAGATVRVRLYSDAALTSLLQDVSATAIPTPVDDYLQTFPVALSAALTTVRGIRVDIASAGSSAVDIGAVEIAGLWTIPIQAGAEFGFADEAQDIQLAGGATVATDPWRPRTMSGQIGLNLEDTDTALDDAKLKGLTVPFVFVEDRDAVSGRNCWLAMHEQLGSLIAQVYGRDRYPLRFREHAR